MGVECWSIRRWLWIYGWSDLWIYGFGIHGFTRISLNMNYKNNGFYRIASGYLIFFVSLQRENMRTKDMDKTTETVPVQTLLIDDLRSIINRARANVALKANAELILMIWEIG